MREQHNALKSYSVTNVSRFNATPHPMPDNLWFILLVIAASIVRWLWQKAQAGKEEPERPVVPDQQIPRGTETQSEEDRIRRFLEALGQPPGTAPPPKVAPRQRVQPTVFLPNLPPLTTAPPPLPPTFAPASQAPPPPLPAPERIFTPAPVQETGFEVRDVVMQSSIEPSAYSRLTEAEPSSLRAKFASPQGLRTAIILREIFGPPRSLQPPDLVSRL